MQLERVNLEKHEVDVTDAIRGSQAVQCSDLTVAVLMQKYPYDFQLNDIKKARKGDYGTLFGLPVKRHHCRGALPHGYIMLETV